MSSNISLLKVCTRNHAIASLKFHSTTSFEAISVFVKCFAFQSLKRMTIIPVNSPDFVGRLPISRIFPDHPMSTKNIPISRFSSRFINFVGESFFFLKEYTSTPASTVFIFFKSFDYVNDVNGATFTSRASSGRGAPKDSQVVIQRNPYGVRVLGRGARSKNKRQSPPASPSGSFISVPATHLERRMEAAQSIRTRDNVAHSWVNHHQLLFGNWNIITLTGKELELVEKAKLYHLDIIGVSSTKRRGSGTVDLDGGWKLFYSGADPSLSAQAGMGILTSPRLSDCVSDWIPLGSRVCMLKLKVLDRSLCLLQVYVPNATSEYQDEANDALLRVSATESTVLMGDFNANVGTDTDGLGLLRSDV